MEMVDANFRRQLGLIIDATDLEVGEELAKYTMDLRDGEEVMLWEPESHSKTQYRPKKLSWRFAGPWRRGHG